MKGIVFAILMAGSISAIGQSIPVTPNLGLQLIPDGYQNWGVPYRTTMTTIDTWSATVARFPGANGIVFSTGLTTSRVATSADVVGLWTSCSSGYLMFNGTCATPAGGVTTVFGRTGDVVAATNDYTFSQIGGTIASGQLPATIAADTTGNALTATQLLLTPMQCSGGTPVASGIQANGDANCTTGGGGGAVSSVFGRTGAVVAVSGDYTVSEVTGAAPSSSPTFTGVVTMTSATNLIVPHVASIPTSAGTFGFNTALGEYEGYSGSGWVFPWVAPGGGTPGQCAYWASSYNLGSQACGGGISGLTAGFIPLAGSATTITANSHLDDGVTTAATITSSEPITINGTTNGSIGLTATGTPPSGAPASTIQIETPNSVTAYGLELPAAQPTVTGQYLTCTAANPSVCSWSQIVGTGTKPSITAGGGAGTSPTVSLDDNAHNSSGTITIILGTDLPDGGILATLTFTPAFSTIPHCVLSPSSADAASNTAVVFNTQSTSTATLTASGTPLGSTLVYNYICQQ